MEQNPNLPAEASADEAFPSSVAISVASANAFRNRRACAAPDLEEKWPTL
jgi:hypothetical protein